MHVDEFTPNAEYKGRAPLVEAQTLLSEAETMEGFVYSWLSEDRSVTFCPGVDDDDKRDSVCILLYEKQSEVAQVYIKLGTLDTLWPNIATLPANKKGASIDPELDPDDSDDSWFEQRDRRLKAVFSDVLMARIIRARDSIDAALSYATSEAGTATLKFVCQEEMEDLLGGKKPDVFTEKGLVWLSLTYMDRSGGRGWGEHFYVTGQG